MVYLKIFQRCKGWLACLKRREWCSLRILYKLTLGQYMGHSRSSAPDVHSTVSDAQWDAHSAYHDRPQISLGFDNTRSFYSG